MSHWKPRCISQSGCSLAALLVQAPLIGNKAIMKRSCFFVVATALMVASASVPAADKAAGESMYADACAQCHGPSRKGMASFPSLTGRSVDYITSRLETYRAGERVGSNSTLMIPNAVDLSDDDIANLAAYIADDSE